MRQAEASNLHLYAALCLTLPKIASHIQNMYEHATVLICFFIVTFTYAGIGSPSGKTTKLCIHTAHVGRHARLCLSLMDRQPVYQAAQCMRQAKAICHGVLCAIYSLHRG